MSVPSHRENYEAPPQAARTVFESHPTVPTPNNSELRPAVIPQTCSELHHVAPPPQAAAPHREFISEAIKPIEGSFVTSSMAAGEPGLPSRFIWRNTEYEVNKILKTWKTTGPCRNGSREQYVRKHWFHIETTNGQQMEIYFDRQPRSKQGRWWLATIFS